jgi:glycosyltransferase involved in cell wall biosynthesis
MLPGREQWVDGVTVTRVPPPLSTAMWAGCSPVQDTDPTVLFVGHLERRKAPEVLMAALGQLAGDVQGLRAVFVGRPFQLSSTERYDEHLRAAAARLGVPCEIRSATAGAQEMRRLYEMARVVAVPSRFETLSLVALEAFACGRPVVMTDAVGAVEWVGPEVADLVVPTGDPSALADAMRPLLRDPERAAQLGALGRRRVLEACSPAAIVDARVAVYRAAVGLPEEVPCSAS